MKDLFIACACFAGGLFCGYLAWKDDGTTSPPCSLAECCRLIRDNPDSCQIQTPISNSITLEADTNILKNSYRDYRRTMRADSLGYSLNRDLISYLNIQITSHPEIMGYRLYPCINEGQNKTLFISLVRNAGSNFYSESSIQAKGFIFNVEGLMGYTGPCPTWCDNNSRIIK